MNKATKALEEQTGLSVTYKNSKTQREGDDYEVEVNTSNLNKTKRYLAQIKTRITNTFLGEAAIQAKSAQKRQRHIFVVDYISPTQAERLRQLNIPFFDTAGNAYFNEPGLYVFVTGKKAVSSEKKKPLRIFSSRGVKLLQGFLAHPNLLNADYRTIARETDVPKTTVGQLMNDLECAGYLLRRSDKERFLTRVPELIRRWAEAYVEKFRVKLNPVRYRSTKYTGRWWEQIDISEYKAVWGGETGGAMLTKHLKPQIATIYADSALPKLQARYGLVRDEKGEIEILKKFWKFGEVEGGVIAPPLVIYADLLATFDERNLETAKLIYDKYLAPNA